MKRTDAEKVLSAQDLVDRLHAMAADAHKDAASQSDPHGEVSMFFRGLATAHTIAAQLLDELL